MLYIVDVEEEVEEVTTPKKKPSERPKKGQLEMSTRLCVCHGPIFVITGPVLVQTGLLLVSTPWAKFYNSQIFAKSIFHQSSNKMFFALQFGQL